MALVVLGSAILGYFVYHNYITPQEIGNEASNVINNASNTIQQASRQQSLSSIQNKIVSLTNPTERTPIAVYYNCKSFIRTDLKTIDTNCGKQYKFNIPDQLEQALQGTALGFVNTTVYQYSANDFKIGLYDQVGEKNYTVTLWQLPQ